MQVIGCQLNSVWEDKPASFARVRALLAGRPVEPGALIVLPEMFATGFSMHVATIGEDAAGPAHQFVAQLAAEYRAFVVAGIAAKRADGRGENLAVVCDPAGKQAASYSKLHPFTFGGESKHYAAGSQVAVVDCGPFRVAPLVCYDLRFPEVARQATRQGANVLVYIANWPRPRDEHWLALLKARAIENQAYVIGVNRAGNDPHLEYAGHSIVLDPRGACLAQAGEAEERLEATLDLAALDEYRRAFPALADMRPEFFGLG